MDEIKIKASGPTGLDDETLLAAVQHSLANLKAYSRNPEAGLKKILLLPPDLTRMHSGAGKITALYYDLLKDTCQVDVMPALGTHEPMSERECREFFGDGLPFERILVHNWRTGVVKIGEVPEEFVSGVSEGLVKKAISVEIDKRLLDESYDLFISIGQVVPHEVAGMANYTKNILVGCGGSGMINESHMLGAFYGMERIMGKDHSPVRKVFDYAETHFLKDLPLMYVLTVTTCEDGAVAMHGLFMGRDRSLFEEAVALSQEKNMTFMEKPFRKVVVYLDEREFKSTWIGNKAIYRTRMAICDGGDLVILAPGVSKFGEDARNDELIRKYGYVGREKVLSLCECSEDLRSNLSVAAHLIHGSSDNRFSITYAVGKLSGKEVTGVNYQYLPLAEAYERYDPAKLKEGYNHLPDGEEVYFIGNPALGLWSCR
jgi:nickel-dependent lactate racemase